MRGPDQDEGTAEQEGRSAPETMGDPDPDHEEPAEAGEIEDLRRELESLNDRHLRLAAEFENYRRRSQTQLGESGIRAQAQLVGTLIDVLDDLDRVTSLDPEAATVEAVLEGVTMVERKMHRLLRDAGLEELDPEGEDFDPNLMEAMARAPAEAQEDDETVAQVLQKGFRFGGHLVRPARVSVRKFE